MKKLLFGLAAFSLLVATTGCSEETVERAGGEDLIEFQALLGKPTKAAERDLGSLRTASQTTAIPVKAYGDDNVNFGDWTLAWNGTDAWTYNSGNPVLQPNFNLTYYAWYPTTTVTGWTAPASGTKGLFSYTVPAVGSQEDLIAAYVPSTNSAAITLQFNHLLSQVNFALQKVKDVKITVNSITLNGLMDEATYTFGTGWGTATTSGTPTYGYDLTGITTPMTDGTIDATPTTSLINASGNNRLMLMPQAFDANLAANFVINFTLADVSGNALVSNQNATVYLKDFTTTTWESGKRYLYVIDFTNYLVDRYIKFDVKVTDWADAPVNPIQIVEIAQVSKASLEGAIQTLFSYNTAGNDTFQISATGALTGNIALDIDSGWTFNSGDKIVIWAGGLDTYNIGVSAGWTAVKNSTSTAVTLTKN